MSTEQSKEFDIQALIDNELGGDDQQRVLAFIQGKPHLQRRYDTLMEQKRLLKLWWNLKRQN